ncbi:DNA photolyase [Wolffia australiana]
MAISFSSCHRSWRFLRPSSVVPRNRCRRLSVRCLMGSDNGKAVEGPALIWFKRDLRLDDHPGLVLAASRHPVVVPIYVFDPRFLRGYGDDILELLLFSLHDLRKALRDQGSDLLLAFGDASDEIMKVANQVKATHIFSEEEVEYNFRTVSSLVKSSLSSALFSWGRLEFSTWEAPLYDIKSFRELPTSYRKFQKLKIPINAPVSPPVLPPLQIELLGADLPTLDNLKDYLRSTGSLLNESWTSIKGKPASYVLSRGKVGRGLKESIPEAGIGSFSDTKATAKGKSEPSVFLSRKSNVVRGGTDVFLNGFAAYLRYLEGTARGDWQELHEKLRYTESRVGASFGALFGAALSLGIVSRRRVHYEALKYEKERNGGFLSPFGYSIFTVSAAVDAAESIEWYWLLAMKSQLYEEGRHPIRIWRWNGHLIQYTAVGTEGPAVLMVHGFGAFSEHYRDNISGIANDGNRVWAITLLGFGRSEKPNVRYSELLWAELVRDFIVDVIGEPVHIVGNSIGGYFIALVAGLWPELANTVVLLNTAGSVIPGYSSPLLMEETRPSWLTWIGSRLLLAYLKLNAESILKKFYPINPTRVDEPLLQEMLRASEDPGVLIVMEGIFNFNLGIPLNYLLSSFGGKALIIQGTKDPLPNALKRLSMIREHCKGVAIKELHAGHCPHDEQPKLVNSIIIEWINKAAAVSSS